MCFFYYVFFKEKLKVFVYFFIDVFSVKIFVKLLVCFGLKIIIKLEVLLIMIFEKIEWQKSKDGIDFYCIKEFSLFRIIVRFECFFYVILKIIFIDKFYYCFLVWNENGEGVSNIVYLDVIGSMVLF